MAVLNIDRKLIEWSLTTEFCARLPTPLRLPSSARSEIVHNSSRLQVRAFNMLHTYYKFRSSHWWSLTTEFGASPPTSLLLPSSARSEIARNSSRLQVRALNMLHTYYKFRSKSLMRANTYKWSIASSDQVLIILIIASHMYTQQEALINLPSTLWKMATN